MVVATEARPGIERSLPSKPIYRFRAFELADEVALLTYRHTSGFPKAEQFGLTSQMRRAAVSVPSNIVEGCARDSSADYLRLRTTAS